MVAFYRTQDLELVRLVLTDPAAWPHIGDDFAPDREEFRPNADPRIWYVAITEHQRIIGLLTFLPRSTVLWEVHLVLARRRRSRGTEILAAGLAWMFENSTARRIVAEIPESNRLAVQLATRVMEKVAVNRCSFLKHGELQDLVLFGRSKG